VSGGAVPGTDAGAERITLIGTFIWAIAAFFFLYEFFLRTFLGSLEPQIMASLRLNAETFSILGSCYYLTYGLMQIPVGIIVDRVGVKWTMTFAALLCGFSAFLFSIAESFGLGFVARLLMGFGSSFAFIALLVIARAWFPKQYFGSFAGLSQLIGTMGPILAGGPLILFLKAEGLDWRQFIGALAFVGIGIAVLSFLFVRTPKHSDPDTVRFLPPKMPLKQQIQMLLTTRQAWYVALYSALIYTAIATLGAIWGTRVMIAKGLTQEVAADLISVLWIGYAVGCPITGFVSDQLKRRRTVLIGLAVLAMISTGMLRFVQEGSVVLFGVVFFMIGFAGGAQNVGFATIVEKVTDRLSATSMGLNNGLMLLFDTVNPIIFGLLVSITLANKNTDQFTSANFNLALTYLPLLCLLALLIAIFLIRETYCKAEQDVTILTPPKPE